MGDQRKQGRLDLLPSQFEKRSQELRRGGGGSAGWPVETNCCRGKRKIGSGGWRKKHLILSREKTSLLLFGLVRKGGAWGFSPRKAR